MSTGWRAAAVLLIGLALVGTSPAASRAETPRSPALRLTAAASNSNTATLFCGYKAAHAALIDQVTPQSWSGWIAQLSGEQQVSVDGLPALLTTRNSPALFNGGSQAYNFVRETILAWYPGQVQDEVYSYAGLTWKNLVLTIPGARQPEEAVLLTAHLDDMPGGAPAPGADDNASGSAALLEAARILQGQSFPRSLRLIWFSGEEQGLLGSGAYAASHDLSNVVGMINLDMYGYDGNNDHCFEMHVGILPQSNKIGQCLRAVIAEYRLDLSYDYLTTSAASASDHASFWKKNIGAVEILENFYNNNQAGGCVGRDMNPYYHTSGDTLARVNQATGTAITRAALAAALSMADPVQKLTYLPVVLR